MRIRRIIIIMKGEKSKNSSVQGKKNHVLCWNTEFHLLSLHLSVMDGGIQSPP